MSLQFESNDPILGRAIKPADLWSTDSYQWEQINALHDEADKDNADLRLKWAHDVAAYYQEFGRTGIVATPPSPPRLFRAHNDVMKVLQDGERVGDVPTPPKPVLPPAPLPTTGPDLTLLNGLKAIYTLLQEVKALLQEIKAALKT